MPIEITPTPTTTTTTVQQDLICNALWIDDFSVTGKLRDLTKVGMSATMVPYAVDTDGSPIAFSGASWPLATSDVYTAAANAVDEGFPDVATAVSAIPAGMSALHQMMAVRAVTLATAQTAADNASAALTTAQTAFNDAVAARTAAYQSRTSPTDPVWVEADNAWRTATANLQQAQANVTTTANNVVIATAAANDPASPKLVTGDSKNSSKK